MKLLLTAIFLSLETSLILSDAGPPWDRPNYRKYKNYRRYNDKESLTRSGRKISDEVSVTSEEDELLSGSNKVCWERMKNSGIDIVNFPFATAHRIHSLTLQDLRYFFDKESPVENGIPTINFDLLSDDMVLENAIDLPSVFASPNMRGMDSILTHLTNFHYEVAKGTDEDKYLPLVLNRIIHKAHMQDLWSMMKPVFDELVQSPPQDKSLCPCVTDIKNNGVLGNLEGMSRGTGSALVGDPEAEYFDMEVYNSTAIQEYWTTDMRESFLTFYDDFLKVDTYGAALFVYCKLKE